MILSFTTESNKRAAFCKNCRWLYSPDLQSLVMLYICTQFHENVPQYSSYRVYLVSIPNTTDGHNSEKM